MSIGNPGIVGSFAALPLSQSHQAQASQGQSAAEQARSADSTKRASDAVGQTNAEEQTSDRDADGRRLLERTLPPAKRTDESGQSAAEEPRQSRDASGTSGTNLDLSG